MYLLCGFLIVSNKKVAWPFLKIGRDLKRTVNDFEKNSVVEYEKVIIKDQLAIAFYDNKCTKKFSTLQSLRAYMKTI